MTVTANQLLLMVREIPVLETERLILRPLVMDDAPLIFQRYATDEQVTRYLTWSPHRTVEDTLAFVQRQIAECESTDNCAWVIALPSERSEPIGMAALRIKESEANFGYVLARSEWGRGYMTEALGAILAFAFSIPAIEKVWAVCDVENRASARVMEKAGLTLEGVRPKYILHPNVGSEPRDAYCYSILR